MTYCRLTSLAALWSFFLVGDLNGQEPLAVQQDFNVELIANVQVEWPDTLPSRYHSYSDVWGYVGSNNREFAIIGAGHGTLIFDLAQHDKPELIKTIPGWRSRWRDFKSYGNYIYAVADEGADGLLIIDMSEAPSKITHSFWRPDLTVGGTGPQPLTRCHNIYIDSTFLYLAGCRPLNDGGVMIFDLSQDPTLPVLLSAGGAQYSHDVFARNGMMFSSDLTQGFSVYDITNVSNPQPTARHETTGAFTHNAWSNDDNTVLFTTDERSGANVDAYDISNLDEIELLDTYRPLASLRNRPIPHNIHFFDDYLVISYYSDGLKIVDVSDPTTMTEVGSFDTHVLRDDGFNGAWGAFPYLPSGYILVSDIQAGLFVLKPTYKRASFIEGTVSDRSNGFKLPDATIKAISHLPGGSISDDNGFFRFGFAGDGHTTFEVKKDGYQDTTVALSVNGSHTVDIMMRPLKTIVLSGKVVDEETGTPVSMASVKVVHSQQEVTFDTDDTGTFRVEILEGDLSIAAGKWGYKHDFEVLTLSHDKDDLELVLQRGYRDDFHFDLGWTVSNSFMVRFGQGWERGIPQYAIYNAEFTNPNGDIPGDLGAECYITGLAGNLGSNLTDTSTITSPPMDLSTYQDPFVNYTLWFYNDGVVEGDDQLQIFVGNGREEVEIERLSTSASVWRERSSFRIRDFIEPSSEMYLKVFAADIGGIHIYEAGIDGFSITEGQSTSSDDKSEKSEIELFPNPSGDRISLRSLPPAGGRIIISDMGGRVRISSSWSTSSRDLEVEQLAPGNYIILLIQENGVTTTRSFTKI